MDLGSLVLGVAGMIAITMKVTDFLKQVTNLPGSKRAVLTQLAAWAGATAVVFLYSASDFGPNVVIGDVAVNDMAWASKVVLGLAIGSAGSAAVDFKKAVDNSDSAAVPPLNV
jgi:hypothetical protein